MAINVNTLIFELLFSIGIKTYTGLIDTGADHTVMKEALGQEHRHRCRPHSHERSTWTRISKHLGKPNQQIHF